MLHPSDDVEAFPCYDGAINRRMAEDTTMLDLQLAGLQELSLNAAHGKDEHDYRFVSLARRRFDAFRRLGRTDRLVGRLLGREKKLGCLEQAIAGRTAHSTVEVGILSVALSDIVGSEGRACDFDSDWRPLNDASQARWMSISMAREIRTPLPPVSLIEVDGKYYVRDGHHRISVARSLGNEYIEAQVTIWLISPAPAVVRPAVVKSAAAFAS
jgi:hypothetical protein